jgi:hypothetical protein
VGDSQGVHLTALPHVQDGSDVGPAAAAPSEVTLSNSICMRARIPATATELAAALERPVHVVRAMLYQLRQQGRVERLQQRVPHHNRNTKGPKTESLWQSMPDSVRDPLDLSARQQDVLECIKRHIEDTRVPPSRADLAQAVGVNLNAIQECLQILARKGAIELLPRIARGIRIK